MSKKKKIIIIICIIVALLVAGLVTWLIIRNNDKDGEDADKPTPVAVEKITITFDADGGEKVEDMVVNKGSSFQLPETTKEGYVFVGWYNGSKLYTDDDTADIEKDTVLTAKWEEIEEEEKVLTVSFDAKGGSKVADKTFKCGKDNAAELKNLPKSKKDSYEFRAWEDKHGKAILDGAKITCEGDKPTLKLYAAWDEKEPTTTPEPTKTPKCPSGYKLEGTKCTVTGTVHETCPEGTKADGSLCIKTSDNNTGTRVCTETTVAIDGKGHTWTGKGDYHFNGSYGKCAYYKWTSYTTKTQCDNARDIYHSTVWVSDLNACYAEDKMNNYETVCSADYQWYSSAELSSKFGIHDNGKCLRKVDKTKYCDEGYTLTAGSCVKTVEATLE